MNRVRDKERQKKIAKERVEILFEQAEKAFPKKPERANRYVELARRIAMKVNLSMPKKFKRRFCKYCYVYLQPSVNSTQRTREGKLVIYCRMCRKYTRIPLSQKTTKK
jgi:ribonuclease P protein subunit RPR2